MDNIRTSIEILFKKHNPEEIIKKYYNNLKENGVNKKQFLARYSYEKSDSYNKDEVGNVLDILDSTWKKLEYVKEDSIFNVLVNFTKTILRDDKGIPVCRYENLFRWRELSYLLGEDLLTTSNFAYTDFINSYDRTIFAWKPIISTDNNQLKEIMRRGCAENHFHLKGSAPHFQLAWISLMNNVNDRDKDFKKIEKNTRLSPDINFGFNENSLELKSLVKKAAAIRWFLFKKIVLKEEIDPKEEKKDLKEKNDGKKEIDPKEDIDTKNRKIDSILKSKDNSEIKLFINDLQNEINVLKYSCGKKFEGEIADYAIPKQISANNYNEKNPEYNGNILLYGERYFLYNIFKKFFQGDDEIIKYKRLFHAYIIIKEKFRDELVQINNRVGFSNFAEYQDRKSIFLGKEIYKKAVLNMAVNSSLYDQNIDHLEARIAPENCSIKLLKEIKKIDKDIASNKFYDIKDFKIEEFEKKISKEKNEEEKKHFYVIHFIKQQEKYKDIIKQNKQNIYKMYTKPLNYGVRKGLRKQANAIINLRKTSGDTKKRIYGIDAANFEIGCRPEVFAQCFRYLRNYKIKNKFENLGKKEIFNLGITYHAGEDFLSIIDGLRAIDETVRFLSYEQGDGIGHALALGVDAREYYKDKNYVLILPKQLNLDNIAWTLAKIREYNVRIDESLKANLVDNYYRLYSEIYDNLIKLDCSPEDYYRAWKLRTDNPEKYISGEYKEKPNLTFWEKCSIDDKLELKELRKNKKLCKLYMNYHYNKEVKEKGAISEEVKVSLKMIKVIDEIQYGMQKELARKNICIETNPSSNYVIGRFRRYDGHPISKFYNLGLKVSDEEFEKCAQLSVSINTDDQGVFSTYLENEYALIALAMEKMKDEDGNAVHKPMMVYEWIDKIRAMGLEQSFQRRERG